MHPSVHCSTVYDGQDMEAPSMSIDRRMGKEDVVHIYNRILLSHQKEWNKAICSNMNGPRACYIEWSKLDRKAEISYHIPYMWYLKRNDTDELTYKTESDRLRKWIHGCQGEGIVKHFGKVMCTLLYLKWITNKKLLYSTWNSAQCYVPA